MAIAYGEYGPYDTETGQGLSIDPESGSAVFSDTMAGTYSPSIVPVVRPDSDYIVRGDYRMPKSLMPGMSLASGPLEFRNPDGSWSVVTAETAPPGYDPRQDSNAQGSNERLRFNQAFGTAPADVPIDQMQQWAVANGWTEPDRSQNDGTFSSMLSSVIPGMLAVYGGVNLLSGLSGMMSGAGATAGTGVGSINPALAGSFESMYAPSAWAGTAGTAGAGIDLGGGLWGGGADSLGGMPLGGSTTNLGSMFPTGGTGSLFPSSGGLPYNPATATVSDIVNAAVGSGGNAIPAGMLTPELAAAAASGTTISSLSPTLLQQLASGLNSALGTDFTGSQLLSGGLSAIGGMLQGNAAQDAAQTSADAQIRAAQIAADAARFKPVGVTTRFGQSTFGTDAQGNVTSAGYNVTPDIAAMRESLIGASPGMLSQFTGSQAATAPMADAAQRAMTLGQGYLNTDPLAQAQKYYNDQQAIMAAQRERDVAGTLAGEFNRGTYGLSTGGTSSGMMGANPRLEALYNAQRQQDLQASASATQGGMDYAKFGAGMVGTGGDLLKSMYGTQAASLDPWKAAMGGAQYIEGLGQNALDMSVNIGKTASPAQSGQLLAQGMLGAAQTMQPANAYSPWGALLSGAGNAVQNYGQPQQQQYQFNPFTGVRL